MKKIVVFFFFIWFLAGAVYAQDKGNTTNDSFNKAKRTLLNEVYKGRGRTFYCSCPFEGKEILPCDNYKPKKESKRSKRVEWEHIVPAAHFGQNFKEWREGHTECVDSKGQNFKGRNCARKMAIPFRYMEADLYNLVPAIGEVNGLRSNYRFGMIAGEEREFGACDIEIAGRIAEPPEHIRGDIARTYQYMAWAYGRGIIGKTNKKLFEAWSKLDPVDQWECQRAQIIQVIQGNENFILKEACLKAGLWDGSAADVSPSVLPDTYDIKDDDPISTEGFKCGNKKYCKQMTSCEEAIFYLKKCGLTRLDGDKDGMPCESLCR
jgi:deoxyribonuclease-1